MAPLSKEIVRSDELARLFLDERAAFAVVCPKAAQASLTVVDRPCSFAGHECRVRDVAYADCSTGEIVMLRRALRFPYENIVAVLRHEFGHICDPRVRFAGRERRADDIAEYVRGDRIYYDFRDVQTIRRGTWPRPSHLHQ